MTHKWRVAVMGLGHWYSGYGLARALPEYPKAELVAVADPNQDHVEQFATTFGIDGYTSYEALLDREDIDIVHIAPPVCDMPRCVIMAAQAGKHMIMGKPMAMNIAQADEMVAAVEAAGITCVCFQHMHAFGAGGLKARLDAGEIGDIVVMHSTGRWSVAEDWYHSGQAGWFADPRCVPGGAFIDEGIYGIEQLLWFAGSDIVSVEGRMAKLVHTELDVEDWGMATYTFANGIIATQEASWTINSPRKTGPSPKGNSVRRMEIIGTRGEIVDDGLHMPGFGVLAKGADGWVFERPGGEFNAPPSPGLVAHLIDCLEQGKEPPLGIRDARKAFGVALAFYEAVKTGRAARPL
ncbi:MAG: Gfo/Idh/MocA family oxidoreductase [Anaerolineales bacterium]